MARSTTRGRQHAAEEEATASNLQGPVNTEIAGFKEEIRSEMTTLLAELEKKLLDQLKSATDQMSGQPDEAAIRELVAEACKEESATLGESGGSHCESKGSRGIFPTIEMAKRERQRLVGYIDRYVRQVLSSCV